LDRTQSAEEIRRDGAYHEAAHAVADVVLGHTVRYVSIKTEGTHYRDICVTAVTHMTFPGMGRIAVPWEALGHAIATMAGNMAMWREAGKPYPWDSWQETIRECEELEELGDPDEIENDTMTIREFCEAAALLGQMVKMPASDELPEGAPALPQMPSTGREAPWCHPGHSNPSSEPSPVLDRGCAGSRIRVSGRVPSSRHLNE